jgi:hypothetical protein
MSSLLLVFLIALSNGPPRESLMPEATLACNRAKKPVNKGILSDLAQVEKPLPIPESARGILWAAACMESGYRVRPRCGDKGKSCGMFQVRKWLTRRYKVDAYDYTGVARALLTQVLRSDGKVRRKCPRRSKTKRFWIAYSWVTRGPNGWNCRGTSRHHRLLKRWKRHQKKGTYRKGT